MRRDPVSASLQDYLEAISILAEQYGKARITDIAAFLGVTKASVVQAVQSLKKSGLVVQERYGFVELTSEGAKLALKVRDRHLLFRRFLVDVLGVSPEVAERDACAMEHAVSLETVEKLAHFLETCALQKKEVASVSQVQTRRLDTLKVGERGRVVSVVAGSSVRQRILEMGLIPGVELEVAGVAPLGDPIRIVVKGYVLTLRKEEASEILVSSE